MIRLKRQLILTSFIACSLLPIAVQAGSAQSQNETRKHSTTEAATSAKMVDGCVSGCHAAIAPRGSLFKQSTVPVAVLAREYLGGSADLCSTAVKGLAKGPVGQCR